MFAGGGDPICRRYHRILDLERFRTMVADGLIAPESFVSLHTGKVMSTTSSLRISSDVEKYFERYLDHKVRPCVCRFSRGARRAQLRSRSPQTCVSRGGGASSVLPATFSNVSLIHFVVLSVCMYGTTQSLGRCAQPEESARHPTACPCLGKRLTPRKSKESGGGLSIRDRKFCVQALVGLLGRNGRFLRSHRTPPVN